MKTATALTLIAIGAIFAFAITQTPPFFDLHIAGWIIMLTGGVGIVLPRSKIGRLRKRTIRRGGQPEQTVTVEEVEVEPKFSPMREPGDIDTRLVDPVSDRDGEPQGSRQ